MKISLLILAAVAVVAAAFIVLTVRMAKKYRAKVKQIEDARRGDGWK